MKSRFTLIASLLILGASAASAQSAVDAMTLSQGDFKGTARFMSMGGAFGALGGDISTLNQNPGGIGIYRSNDLGFTIDIDFQHSSTTTNGWKMTDSQTKFHFNNFGYVGAIDTGSDVMPFINFGASYSRIKSFDRRFRGRNGSLPGSYSTYIAGVTSANGDYAGWPETDLQPTDTYNPYTDSWAPWMSILAYNSYIINPYNAAGDRYQGLWQNGTSGDSEMIYEEKGYIDEYNISFGGNVMNSVYWGMGFGITDINYTANSFYDEQLSGAAVPDVGSNGGVNDIVNGNAYYGLDSWKHVTGTGFNFKIGLIVKPVNELRLGVAVHTPTYYNLTQQSWAQINYNYSTGADNFAQTNDGYNYQIDWKLRTPWRLIASAAGVIGGQGIISLDYEYRPYQNMAIRDVDGDPFTYGGTSGDFLKGDINRYYQTSNIVRLGLEYRLTPQWSIRAGMSYESSPSTAYARSADADIYTEGPQDCGTMPAYTMDKSTVYVTGGLGYRYKGFYVDAAYVYKNQKSEYRPFTPSDWVVPDATEVTQSNSQVVLSMGFRF